MADSQAPVRYMCSELITVNWEDIYGREQESVVNLEEVWERGALLQFEVPVRSGTGLRMKIKDVVLDGEVRRCSADFVGFIVEVEFVAGQQWSRELCEPDHFFDPRSLLRRTELRKKNNRLLDDCTGGAARHVT